MRRVIVYKNYELKELDYEGTFHQWGQNYEEFESGPGIYPIAIVEKDDGQITLPYASLVRFLHQ